jgi:hypothetical protein
MTVCKLEMPVHYFYMYRKAKIASVNIKNYITASYFCKKIIGLEKSVYNTIIIIFSLKEKSKKKTYERLRRS